MQNLIINITTVAVFAFGFVAFAPRLICDVNKRKE